MHTYITGVVMESSSSCSIRGTVYSVQYSIALHWMPDQPDLSASKPSHCKDTPHVRIKSNSTCHLGLCLLALPRAAPGGTGAACSDFQAQVSQVNVACCGSAEGCGDGFPLECGLGDQFECAAAYLPFIYDCADTLAQNGAPTCMCT